MKPNNLTRDIAKGVSKYARPSLKLIGKWRLEWISTGWDYKCTFDSYKRRKIKLWLQERREKKNKRMEKELLKNIA